MWVRYHKTAENEAGSSVEFDLKIGLFSTDLIPWVLYQGEKEAKA
jgi:hypothetical protein